MKTNPILILSCAVNIIAALYITFQPSAAAPNSMSRGAAKTNDPGSNVAGSGGQLPEALSRQPITDLKWDADNDAAIVDVLRRAGTPPSVIVAMANALVGARYQDRIRQASRIEAKHAWQRIGAAITPEQRARVDALRSQARAEVESLVGDELAALTLESMKEMEACIGFTDDQKLAIAKIHSDNNKILWESVRSSPGDQFAVREMVQAETNADLAAVLSPEQLAQYKLYASDASKKLASALNGADIDDAGFSKALEAYNGATPRERHRAIAQVAGDSVAVRYLRNTNPNYGPGIAALQSAGMSDAAILRSFEAYERTFPGNGKTVIVDQEAQYRSITAEMTPEQEAIFGMTPLGTRLRESLDRVRRYREMPGSKSKQP